LSVWREIVRLLPAEATLYLADQAHVPYGERSTEEVAALTARAVAWLREQGAKLVVIACNTASSAALSRVRARWPELPIVGMEPAVKPASQRTHTGHVGVLATPGTLRGERFSSLVERFANGVHVHTVMGSGLVELVEANRLEGPEVEARLRAILAPVQDADIDHLVLGCTHFPFLADAIARVLTDGVKLVDPAPAVARQTRRVLEARALVREDTTAGAWQFVTTGPLPPFRRLVARLVAQELAHARRPIHFASVSLPKRS
jgi:glutamate racemase